MKDNNFRFEFRPIEAINVEKLLLSIKNDKPSGLDGLNGRLLKKFDRQSTMQPCFCLFLFRLVIALLYLTDQAPTYCRKCGRSESSVGEPIGIEHVRTNSSKFEHGRNPERDLDNPGHAAVS